MAKITSEEILTYSPFNTGGDEQLPKYERKLASKIYSFISAKKRFIIAVDGLRRVGKSIMLKQLLDKIRKDGRTVFYFSFDKKAHQNPETLEEVVKFFTEKDGNGMICLDEVGKIEDWAGVLKKYYDRTNAAFFVSSSAALHIKKGTESLAGRMLNYTLPPLGFDEYLELKNAKQKKIVLDFSNPEAVSKYGEHLEEFFHKGSYPEIYGVDDREVIKNYIRNSTVEKMIYEDIPSIFKIEHVSKLAGIFEYFANYSGDLVQEKTLSGIIGLSEPSVSDYVSYLEESHLVKRVFTEANYAKMVRRKKKGYVASASIYSNLTSNFSDGKLAETAVFEKLAKFNPLVYRDEMQREVDFTLRSGKKHVPIEVKFSEHVSASELVGLRYYMEKRKLTQGHVIYNGQYDRLEVDGKTVHLIPLSTFLAADEIII